MIVKSKLIFNVSDNTNRLKDIILTTLLALAIIACYLVYKRYQWAQHDLSQMSKHMVELAKAEETLMDLQVGYINGKYNAMNKLTTKPFILQRELEKARTDQEKKETVVEGSSSGILGDDPDELAKLREENMVRRPA